MLCLTVNNRLPSSVGTSHGLMEFKALRAAGRVRTIGNSHQFESYSPPSTRTWPKNAAPRRPYCLPLRVSGRFPSSATFWVIPLSSFPIPRRPARPPVPQVLAPLHSVSRPESLLSTQPHPPLIKLSKNCQAKPVTNRRRKARRRK